MTRTCLVALCALLGVGSGACKKKEGAGDVKSDDEPSRSSTRYVRCQDPRQVEVTTPRSMGVLCGKEIHRLGFQDGITGDACAGLGGKLTGSSSCKVTLRFVDIARPQIPAQPGFFCQGTRDGRVTLTTEFFDVTSPVRSAPGSGEPAVSGVVLAYVWEVGGAEKCALGMIDHDVASGALGGANGNEGALMREQLPRLHDAVWDRLLQRQDTSVRWQCLLHPHDPI